MNIPICFNYHISIIAHLSPSNIVFMAMMARIRTTSALTVQLVGVISRILFRVVCPIP